MRLFPVAVLLSLILSVCTAGTDIGGMEARPRSADAALRDYVEAFNTGDVSALFAHFDDQITFSLKPLTWSPAKGQVEAVAATMRAVQQGWKLEITDRVAEDGTLIGRFTLRTHGPILTGSVTLTFDAGGIANLTHNLDQASRAALESPYLYVRRVQPFAPLAGARGFWGELDGALYQIEVPNLWNGGLVIWGSGFKGFALDLGVSPPPMSEWLVRNGYAWAATSFSTNGFDAMRFADDLANLHDHFIKEFGKPEFSVVAGTSMGGAVSLLSQQLSPDRYDGALAVCSPIDPETGNYFGHYLALAAYLARIEQAQFDSAGSLEQLTRQRIIPSLRLDPAAQWRFEELMGSLSGGPRPFRREGFALSLESNFDFANWVVAGGEFTNVGFRYPWVEALAVSADELNDKVVRISTGSSTSDSSRLTGEVRVPTIMLHTTGDGLVPISSMQAFGRLAEGAGDGGRLVQRAIRAAGHCEFTAEEIESAIADLFGWVEQGIHPEGEHLLGSLERAGIRFTEPVRDGDPGGL